MMDIELVHENEALQFLVDHELNGTALGITKQVIDKGRGSLSPKQEAVFQSEVVEYWLERECHIGPHPVEPDELIFLWENRGICSRHANMIDRD